MKLEIGVAKRMRKCESMCPSLAMSNWGHVPTSFLRHSRTVSRSLLFGRGTSYVDAEEDTTKRVKRRRRIIPLYT